ncbi:hypothetical protein ABPG77_002976 [Micractinium sp. CCAP 211/92]
MQAVCSAQRPVAALQRRAVRASSSSSAFMGSSMRRAPLRVSSRPAARQVTVMGLFGLGVPELAVIAGVAALIFGPSKLPELGKGLGKTVKNFQSAAKEFEKELKEAAAPDDQAAKPAAPAAGEQKKDEPASKP